MCKPTEYREMTGKTENTELECGPREHQADCRERLLLNAFNKSSGTRSSARPEQIVVTPPGSVSQPKRLSAGHLKPKTTTGIWLGEERGKGPGLQDMFPRIYPHACGGRATSYAFESTSLGRGNTIETPASVEKQTSN